MKKFRNILSIVICLVFLLSMTACPLGKGAKVEFEDYTGNAPNGALGTVKYISEHPDYKGLKVVLRISGFGNVEKVNDQSNVQAVSEALVEYATLENSSTGWTDKQYYYTYHSDEFKAGKACKLTLYYLVPPESADSNLTFTFDYPEGSVKCEAKCDAFD